MSLLTIWKVGYSAILPTAARVIASNREVCKYTAKVNGMARPSTMLVWGSAARLRWTSTNKNGSMFYSPTDTLLSR